MNCNNAAPLIPSYLDGELTEAQAGPLRKHLMDCAKCRMAAQGDKALKNWFLGDEPVAVPAGFAERVARRAYAGDLGDRDAAAAAGAPSGEGVILQFVLKATSIAAIFLIALSLGISALTKPHLRNLGQTDGQLMADDRNQSLNEILDRLEELNRDEEAAAAAEAEAGEPAGPQKR